MLRQNRIFTRSSIAALAAVTLLFLAGCAGSGDQADPSAARSDAAESRPQPAGETAPADVELLSAPVQAQIDYVLTYWKDYNADQYGVLGKNDCVNFASQSLIARGWQQDDEWFHADDVFASSASWRSSTAMRDWLETRPDLATPLDDTQRDQVKVGDIAQFDWDGSGDRDHTGIVTRVTHDDGGIQIAYAGHTLDSDYRDVDESITVDHPGGSAFYWSIAD